MPLSEHEQRLLDQIERALYAEDPKFASAVRSTNLSSHYRRRMLRAGLGVALGLLLLLGGVVLKVVPVAVIGFVVMLIAVLSAASAWTRIGGQRDPERTAPRKGPRRRRASLLDRFEERWRRRMEHRSDD